MMATFDENKRACLERDAMIRDWQVKSDATYRPAPRPGLLRQIAAIVRSYPGSLAWDASGLLMIFFFTWIGLLLTGEN